MWSQTPCSAHDVGDRVDRVDRAGQRRPRGRDDGDGDHAGGAVARERVGERGRVHPARAVERDPAHGARAQPARLDRAHDRVVRLVGAVDGGAAAADAVVARAGQRALARGEQRGEVRRHAAARERALGEREADELGDPAQRLLLDAVRAAGRRGEVRVVGGGERGGEHAHLQAARADVGEEQRARGGDARVEHPRGVGQRGLGVARRVGQRGGEPLGERGVQARLGRARRVERRPRVGDHARERAEHGLAVGERRQVGLLVLRGGAHAARVGGHAGSSSSSCSQCCSASPMCSAIRRAARVAVARGDRGEQRAVLGDVGALPARARGARGEQAPADLDDPQRLDHGDELAVAGGVREHDVEVAAGVVRGDPRVGGRLARRSTRAAPPGAPRSGAARRAARCPARPASAPRAGAARRRAPGSAARKPRLGRNSARPSPVRRRSASRIGVREIPSCSASSTWPSRAPGGISPSTSIERMRS